MADRRQDGTERTAEMRRAFHRGVAQVSPPAAPPVEPFPTPSEGSPPGWWGYSGASARRLPRPPMRYRLGRLRRGGHWTTLGALIAFVCWGIWAISVRGDLTTPVLAFVLVLLVAAGVFALARLVGRLLLERGMRRHRASAWPSHLATGVFLGAAGLFYLRQTEWVVDAWTWLRALR